MGGRDEGNTFLIGGAFCEAKYEKLRRRKSEGGAGIHFPHTPFSSRPARAEFSKINFRIFVKKSSDFVQKVPPFFKIGVLGDCCLALAEFIPHRTCSGAGLGLGKSHDFERIFEIQKQFLPAQTEVRFAEGKHKFEKFINQSFFFRPPAGG